MTHRNSSQGRVSRLAAVAIFLGLAAPAAALTPPPVETTMAHVNCSSPLVNNPGPGTRGADCEGYGDFGTGGAARLAGMSVTSQCSKARARVTGTCESIPYPETGNAPAVSWVGYAEGRFGYKVGPAHAGASAATVRLRVEITSAGFGDGGWGSGYVRGYRNGTALQLFNHPQPATVVETVELQPESFCLPDSGEYLLLQVQSACACGSSRITLFADCDSDSIARVTIDPTDPNAADYVLVRAPNPSAMTLRMADPTTLAWDPVVEAVSYDIVRGDLMMLRSSGGDFTAATDSCDASGLIGTSIPVVPDPPIDAAWFYLGRPIASAATGSFDSIGDGLVEPRDTEIALSADACP